ncbi:arginine--tRNA ligase [bacterium]|nr:arginine--tRNA ligase [bacterium]
MKDTLKNVVNNALKSLELPVEDFVIEHPALMSHGDYATNVALVVAKEVGQNPRELAEKIMKEVVLQDLPEINQVSIAGPGFINFTLSRTFFTKQIKLINTIDGEWGKNGAYLGKKVLVEYTDPNPFKEFHIGHMFTNIVGESLSRLFVMAGADVKRLNYQGDVGMHVASAIWGMQQMGLTADSQFGPRELGEAYAKGATAAKNNESAKQDITTLNKKIYDRSDEAVNQLYDKGRAVSLEYFEDMYAILGTKFDHYFFESEAGPKGQDLVLAHPEVFVDSDGAKIFPGEQHGLHTRVFINREGLPTYEAKELALAEMKEDECGTHDLSVVSTANEINEYFKVLLKAMSLIHPDLAQKTEHIGHGMVRLTSGKMSSRTGDVIPARDFIDSIKLVALNKVEESGREVDEQTAKMVAMGAIKYETLRGSIFQDSVFDEGNALSFEGNSGPYLQYTYARIQSVKEKAEKEGVATGLEVIPKDIYDVERVLYRFPEVVEEALVDRSPHKVAVFLTELASEFNAFYSHEKIADVGDELASYKLALSDAVAETLKTGLWILGIDAPERM